MRIKHYALQIYSQLMLVGVFCRGVTNQAKIEKSTMNVLKSRNTTIRNPIIYMTNSTTDFCAQPSLMSVADALNQMQKTIEPITDVEAINLIDSLDRVLAAPIYSHINVPSHDNSAMDGYAFRHQDGNQFLRLIGKSLAGHAFSGELQAGDCVQIMTGASVPNNADTVVIQEQVILVDNKISLQRIPQLRDNIRRAGEDIPLGSLVLPQGHRITPIDIGLLASLGCATVKVYRRLRIAILSTGDELTPIDKPLNIGNIYDSNRHALNALLQRLNIEIIDLGLCPDQPEKINAAFKKASQVADAVISSGGVSVGEADYTKDVLENLGTIHFWKVAMKPKNQH